MDAKELTVVLRDCKRVADETPAEWYIELGQRIETAIAALTSDAAQAPTNGIPATLRHDEGAIARCSYCGRYSIDPQTLSDRQPKCECGEKHGWSGSFIKPGPDAKWSGAAPVAPAAAAPSLWQPIETVPKDGTEVALLFAAEVELLGETRPRVRAASWRIDWTIPYRRDNPPTHWTPMPGAPDAVPASPAPLAAAGLMELREAARKFFNLTQGDSTVIIRAPSAKKRDAIVAAGQRLRNAILATTHGDKQS